MVLLQLALLFCFGFFGQMACGAAFGIVPFLSHHRSGLTVGVVAAGGNVGSVVTQVGGRLPGLASGNAEAVGGNSKQAGNVPGNPSFLCTRI